MSQKHARKTPAQQRADEALEQVARASSQPTRKALDFLLRGSHDAPAPDQTQTRPRPDPDQSQPKSSPRPKRQPAAPARDFNRRANSIEREALPAGAFPGASKKLYDALYLRTRGAVTAKHVVQATRRELMQWSGIKNIKTVNVHLRRLRLAGLVVPTKMVGEHEGSLYEVFLPEEADPDQTQTNPRPDPSQKLDSDQAQKTVWVGSGNQLENKATSGTPKTSFKTKDRSDDEPLAELLAKLQQVSRELTGKELSAAERAKWGELGELLVIELKIAAARTGSVSSVPAFLTEHLRRRLWKKGKAQLERESREVSADSTPQVDTSKCPDCGGSGWWYPEGTDKGVAKCKHSNMEKRGGQVS
jgi:hypothetical protein